MGASQSTDEQLKLKASLSTRGDSEEATEEDPLIQTKSAVLKYDALIHRTDIAGRYDSERLATVRVFSVLTGSVFTNNTLWWETGVNACVFLSTFIGVKILSKLYGQGHYHEFIGKESEIRAFLSMFSALIGLLLSFYTALNLSRWWEMRLGVQDVQEGAAALSMFLTQGVTKDPDVLSAVHRYSRASLCLIFAASQQEDSDSTPLQRVLKRGLLTHNEVEKLKESASAMPFIEAGTLWMWLANVVYKLNAQGLLQGPPHLCGMLEACNTGRSGIAKIQTLLQTPIPMGYVHLLCLMVKLHNIILSLLYALICVMHAGGHPAGWNQIALFRTAFRAFFMPFMYNAILILNLDLTDPFGTDADDFDFTIIDVDIEQTMCAGEKAAANLPEWMDDRKFVPFAAN